MHKAGKIGRNIFLGSSILAALTACEKKADPMPNIVLIMADDMGYECLGCNGSTSYQTPHIDEIARQGIRYTHCYAQPLSTPSRVKLMTGMYNYRNYEYFGYLNPNQTSFANILKEAGYATAIAGKWQLNGLYHNLEGNQDSTRPYHFGFDSYCLWQLTETAKSGERFAKPFIRENGKILDTDIHDYGPDIFCDFALRFIEEHKDSPFFLYYPMVLVHAPFVPTPDSEEWQDSSARYRKDTAFFRDMMHYTDKIVGKIHQRIVDLGLSSNTLFIFTGDNGTHVSISSRTDEGVVKGAKGNTIDAGTHVPLIMKWPNFIEENQICEELIDFTDFFATFSDIAGVKVVSDGESLLPLLKNGKRSKENVFIHYDPQWGKNVNKYRNQFVRNREYKLYQDGRFFHIPDDPLEKKKLSTDSLSRKEQEIMKGFQKVLDTVPEF